MTSPFVFNVAHSALHQQEYDFQSDSEFEHLSDEHHKNIGDEVHFWYGRLLLTKHLAQTIAAHAPSQTPTGSLDWMLIKAMASFPYSDTLTKLQLDHATGNKSSLPRSKGSHFTDCVTMLGAVALKHKDDGKWVEGYMPGKRFGRLGGDPYGPGASPIDDTLAVRSPSTSVRRSLSEDDPELPRYTMTLKERGDVDGFEPEYDISTLSLIPPRFKAVICLGKSSYEGQASTKKRAKHLASKNACLSLGISL